MSVSIVREARTYGSGSDYSFWVDQATVSSHHTRGRDAAQERLDRHAVEIATEIKLGSPEGLRAARMIREQLRVADPVLHERAYKEEIRAITSGAGSGGSFVTPVFFTEDWLPAFDVEPVFTNQCNQVRLPDFGLSVSVPTFTAGGSAQVQTDGNAVSLDNPDPVAGYRQVPVQTLATGVVISQQLVDRGGPVSFDSALQSQLALNINAQLDAQVLGGAISAGVTTAGAGPASAGAFLGDVASARERAYQSGTRTRVTQCFVSDHVFGWLSRLSDGAGRPILLPHHCPALPPVLASPEDDDRQLAGFTGLTLPGGILLYVDENLSPTGNVVVARPATVLVAIGSPVYRVIEASTYPTNLQCVAEVYQYFVSVPLVPGAIQTVTGYASAS